MQSGFSHASLLQQTILAMERVNHQFIALICADQLFCLYDYARNTISYSFKMDVGSTQLVVYDILIFITQAQKLFAINWMEQSVQFVVPFDNELVQICSMDDSEQIVCLDRAGNIIILHCPGYDIFGNQVIANKQDSVVVSCVEVVAKHQVLCYYSDDQLILWDTDTQLI